ncbi:ferredoxin [Marisediminicola antarctica]|uniref:Ferredoxin n=1 Tax=Marisediminicola antarctica TaxID=674079 RepID=A0A7L5AMY0_9MICO|nr:ferredoxin [Marisediminicola antarctica]QHO70491.1 ferredoxin [Marisediminicola antarctica]
MIKIEVDMALCQHYGQCVFEAPNIFKLNDDDKLEYVASADDSERDNVESAVDVCPMQAIRIVE